MKILFLTALIVFAAYFYLLAFIFYNDEELNVPEQSLCFIHVHAVKNIDEADRRFVLVKNLRGENLITIYPHHVENAKQLVCKEEANEIAYIQQHFDLVYENI